jgi:quercetin dioxygenase-like cupin family protein
MKLKVTLAAAAAAAVAVVGVGVAFADHAPEIDPATVPTGFFVAPNHVADVPLRPIRRAVKQNGADVFVQHLRLSPNQASAWHTHPGPVIVTIQSGSLTYQHAAHNECHDEPYRAGTGFVDPGFGHVHRVIAGPAGTELYATFLLPPGSENHLIPMPAPEDCS